MPRPLALFLTALAPFAAVAVPLDDAAYDQGGEIAYWRALKPAAEEKRLNAERDLVARVRGIANRIVVAAVSTDPASRAQSWTINVVTDAAADVVVYPGDRVLVNCGLATVGLTDEELAAVLAHATAHALLGHDRRRLEEAVSATDASSPDPNRRALALATAAADVLKRRSADEAIVAADRTSVELLARAAYSPRAAAGAWRKLPSGSPLAQRYRVTDARIAALEAAAERALPLYEEVRARAVAQPRPEKPGTPGGTRAIR